MFNEKITDIRWLVIGYMELRAAGWQPRWAYNWARANRRRVHGVAY